MYSCHKDWITKDELLSYWIINRVCNYRCPYCATTPMQSVAPTSKEETVAKAIEVYNYLETIKPVHLVITGGEPTLMDLPDILSRLSMEAPITIFTNLSQSVEYYLDLNTIHRIALFCSYHPTEVPIETFLSKVNTLAIAGISVTAKIMVLGEAELSQAKLIKEKLNSEVKVEFHTKFKEKLKNRSLVARVLPLTEARDYLLDGEAKSLPELRADRRLNVRGWNCTAGENSLCIDFYGRVYPCKTYFRAQDKAKFTIFDDFPKKYKELKKITKCPFRECTTEFEILKWSGERP